jgi:hypothetical protein
MRQHLSAGGDAAAMNGADEEVEAARQSLLRARDELAGRLEAEEAWRALKQLEARLSSRETGGDVDFEAIRARLMAGLDAAVPQWRTFASIERAILALGPGPERAARPPAKTTPPAADEPQLTRYAPASLRPPPLANGSTPLSLAHPTTETDVPAQQSPRRRSRLTMSRVKAALRLSGRDDAARLSDIEAEVERLVHPDAADLPSPPVPSPPQTASAGDTPVEVEQVWRYGEEAEVEIIYPDTPPPTHAAGSATRLADRLDGIAGATSETESAISLQPTSEEAIVEIVPAEAQLATAEDGDVPPTPAPAKP